MVKVTCTRSTEQASQMALSSARDGRDRVGVKCGMRDRRHYSMIRESP